MACYCRSVHCRLVTLGVSPRLHLIPHMRPFPKVRTAGRANARSHLRVFLTPKGGFQSAKQPPQGLVPVVRMGPLNSGLGCHVLLRAGIQAGLSEGNVQGFNSRGGGDIPVLSGLLLTDSAPSLPIM